MKIPIILVLPSFFPVNRPRVFLNFELSVKAIQNLPYLKGKEVCPAYILNWDGNNINYNLMGLYNNL